MINSTPLQPEDSHSKQGGRSEMQGDSGLSDQNQESGQSEPLDHLENSSLPSRSEISPDLVGLTVREQALLTEPLPHSLPLEETIQKWSDYQETISGLLIRMGKENGVTGQITRLPWIRDLESLKIRLSLIPMLGDTVQRTLGEGAPGELLHKLAGECSLMELSAAAGYRTFCFEPLVRGLLKSGKMRDNSSQRMFDTFEFLNTMMQYPYDHPRTVDQLDRTNNLHKRYRVAGNVTPDQRDLFKYIALNMFYIGPRMRPDLTPQEKHAICGLTVLVAERMGHRFDGSVLGFEEFIDRYEREKTFDPTDQTAIRRQAIRIAQESQAALRKVPVVSKDRVHGLVPYRFKKILEID